MNDYLTFIKFLTSQELNTEQMLLNSRIVLENERRHLDNQMINANLAYRAFIESKQLTTTEIIEKNCIISKYKDCKDNVDEDKCPIDHSEFRNNDNIMTILYCNHSFRERPLRRQFLINGLVCPLCRYKLK